MRVEGLIMPLCEFTPEIKVAGIEYETVEGPGHVACNVYVGVMSELGHMACNVHVGVFLVSLATWRVMSMWEGSW